MRMFRLRLISLLALILAAAPTASADVIQTTDGRRIEGAARFADGFVFVRSETAPARLKLEEIASLQRDAAAEEPPAAGSTLRGLQAEYFADVDFKQSAAVLLADSAYYDLGTGAPNAYTPDRYSARFTGWLTAPRSGTYRFRTNNLSRAVVGDRVLNADPAADRRGLELEADQRVPIVIQIRKTTKDHFRGGLYWSEGDDNFQRIPVACLTPPDDFLERIEQFRRRYLPVSPGGLKGEYFADAALRDRRFVRLDSAMAFDFAKPAAISPEFKDRFAVRWTGRLKAPKTGTATIAVTTAARLFINDTPVIDAWVGTEKRPREGTFDFKAGEFYNLKLECIHESQGWGQMRLTWRLPHSWMSVISADDLYPPDDMPRVQILSPLRGADIDATAGVPVQVIAHAGKGSVRKVEILARDEVLAEAVQPPYHLMIHPQVAGEMTIRARITNSAGFVAVSDPVVLSISNAPGEIMGGQWGIGSVGGAQAPQVSEADGRLEITGTAGAFGDRSRLPVVSRLLRGDGQIDARLVEVRGAGEAIPLGGLTIRRSMNDSAPHITLLGSLKSGWFISRAISGRDGSYLEKPLPLPVWLRVQRSGAVVTAAWSGDGESWTTAGAVILGDDRDLVAGLTALSLNGNDPVTAVFDNISIRTSRSTRLVDGPGVQLRSGSIVRGAVEIGDARITVRTAAGQVQTFPRPDVARIFFGAVDTTAADGLTPGWRGAIVNGDLIEGEPTRLAADSAVIDSLIFGPQPVNTASGLRAIIIGDVEIDPAATLIRHGGGQSLARSLRLDADKLIVDDPAVGTLRLAITDIASLQRPH